MTRDNLARFLKALKVDKINTFCILNNVQGKLVAMSSTDDSNLTTIVQNEESFDFDEPFVIRDIDRLIKMLGLHDETINIRLKDNKLVIKDTDTVSEYVTAIKDRFKVNKMKYTPTILGEITLSKEIIRKMVHAMKVMNDSTLVSFDLGEDSSIVTIGSANDFSNEVTFAVPSKKSNISSISEKFYLNLQIVKALLETHVECTDARLEIHREPAVKFLFKYDGLAANYDLLKMSI